MVPEAPFETDALPGVPHPRHAGQLFGQAAAEDQVLSALTSGRSHHAWLITGPKGVGKATLAWRMARFLITGAGSGGLFGAPENLDVDPADPDVQLMDAGVHPRLFVLRRALDEKKNTPKAQITVDEARKLKGFFAMSAADGGHRVVIVDAADEMNPNAANAILKVLEEPPAQTTLLLIAHRPARLLPTIRSRCRTLRLPPLDEQALLSALEQAGIDADGAAGLASLADGSVAEAVRLIDHGGADLYAEIIKLLSTLPGYDRPAAIKLADSCTGAANAARFEMVLDLFDRFLSRTARAGLLGPPEPQAAPGEALLLAKLSPHDVAARVWADLQQTLSDRARHGAAVNLDPAALILDITAKIEATARGVVSA